MAHVERLGQPVIRIVVGHHIVRRGDVVFFYFSTAKLRFFYLKTAVIHKKTLILHHY